ncbi:MAG: 16S rRNA (cytidine(1402)-2'-O)-methyltransferase [Eubacteriaceae bacterium]
MNIKGKCYLVATPIGNLEDISYRAVRILKEVDIIAAEDTRNTIKLLNYYNISTKLTSYHQHNEVEKSSYLVDLIQKGSNIAIVSDAGMPGISDPGYEMVLTCISNEVEIQVIPGASAMISALVISGVDSSKFTFQGFLSKDKKERKKTLTKLMFTEETIILYESPHRLLNTLGELKETLGNRNISIVRELTKLNEEIIREDISRAINYFMTNSPRGEFVLVIEGNKEKDNNIDDWQNISLDEHLEYYLNKNVERKDAVKLIAKDRGIPKRIVYEKFMKK